MPPLKTINLPSLCYFVSKFSKPARKNILVDFLMFLPFKYYYFSSLVPLMLKMRLIASFLYILFINKILFWTTSTLDCTVYNFCLLSIFSMVNLPLRSIRVIRIELDTYPSDWFLGFNSLILPKQSFIQSLNATEI